MTLTRIVTVLIFAVLAADYSHGCDHQLISMCSRKVYDIHISTNLTGYDLICRSDVINYVKCVYEVGQPCGILSEYFTNLGVSSWRQIENQCGSAGYTISQTVLPTYYSQGCDQQRLSMCSQKIYDSLGSANWTNLDFVCRADVTGYVKCAFEERQACDIFTEYFIKLGISSWTEMEKMCASAGHPISQSNILQTVLPTDYSHGCDQQRLSMCSQKMNDSLGSANWTKLDFVCRSDVIGYVKCSFEEGQACNIFNEYFTKLGISSWAEMEKMCASAGHPISQSNILQNAARQTLPSAVIILGLLTALLVRIFPL